MPAKARHAGAMHEVTNKIRRGKREYTATLLRRSYREDERVKKETLANLPHLPVEAIDAIRRVLTGETLMSAQEAFEVELSLPVRHVNTALVMARRLDLAKLLDARPSRQRDLCMAMFVSRVIFAWVQAVNSLEPGPVDARFRARSRECG